MLKSLVPIVFIGVALGLFFMYTNPTYSTGDKSIKALQTQVASYNEALSNAKSLQAVRDELATRYNAFAPADLERLNKLLPDSVNNIRLILDIKGIADKYTMQIENVKFQTSSTPTANANAVAQSSASLTEEQKDYGTFDFSFLMWMR